jgi:hypothetical protein
MRIARSHAADASAGGPGAVHPTDAVANAGLAGVVLTWRDANAAAPHLRAIFIDAQVAMAAQPVGAITVIPGAPAHVAGVVLVGAELIPVVRIATVAPRSMLQCQHDGTAFAIVGYEHAIPGVFPVSPVAASGTPTGRHATLDLRNVALRERDGADACLSALSEALMYIEFEGRRVRVASPQELLRMLSTRTPMQLD